MMTDIYIYIYKYKTSDINNLGFNKIIWIKIKLNKFNGKLK